ncbi:MAG: head decoration protein [Clostridiales bacterium]|jgi:hypothetical protein|nr:head decoration protein [Clostridiales bacterium]
MAELGSVERNGLIAGDYPTKTEAITITGPAEFKRGDVVGVTDAGVYALADSSKSDGSQNAVGIICDDIIVEDGATAESVMYVKGEFINRFLQFGGTDTADKHKRHMTAIGLIVRDSKVEGGKYSWQ